MTVRAALVALTLLATACKGDKPQPAAGSATAKAPIATAPIDAPPSQGFLPPQPEPPPTPAEAAKLAAQSRKQSGLLDLDAERAARPRPSTGADLYVDGTKVRTVTIADGKRVDLATILGKDAKTARGVLVRGELGARWYSAADLTAFALRTNRQHQIKLDAAVPVDDDTDEARHGTGQGGGGGRGGRKGRRGDASPSHREARERELRDVTWLEVRSASSPKLPGEP